MKFNVPDMSCGHCKMTIEKAVTAADDGAALEFDMDARTVSVDSTLDAAALTAIIEKEGYPATAVN